MTKLEELKTAEVAAYEAYLAAAAAYRAAAWDAYCAELKKTKEQTNAN
jgi:hypothetical protein